jgi:hypothetical protein
MRGAVSVFLPIEGENFRFVKSGFCVPSQKSRFLSYPYLSRLRAILKVFYLKEKTKGLYKVSWLILLPFHRRTPTISPSVFLPFHRRTPTISPFSYPQVKRLST